LYKSTLAISTIEIAAAISGNAPPAMNTACQSYLGSNAALTPPPIIAPSGMPHISAEATVRLWRFGLRLTKTNLFKHRSSYEVNFSSRPYGSSCFWIYAFAVLTQTAQKSAKFTRSFCNIVKS
jgi:hypothetical protein